jgi:glycosyltransferase involved in cell wall biosynthesis
VVVTGEPHDPQFGTSADAFREISPNVYTAPDYLDWRLNFSYLIHLIERFNPKTLYIANGVAWLYDLLHTIKNRYPNLRMANQVYDALEGWINHYTRNLVNTLDANIGVNKKIGKAFVEKGAPLESIYIIPNGIDPNKFNPTAYSPEKKASLRKKLGIPPNTHVVTFISRVHPQKRPMDFVELARRFSYDPSITFLMVGDGPLAETVQREIEKIGLKNLIRHSFYRPSSDIFAITDVLVLPSSYEGMPLVLLEAQTMGKPVVATDVGNNRDVLETTQGGIVISKIGDIKALAKGIQDCLKNPPNSQRVRQSIIENFSLEKMGRNYQQALLG